MCELLCLLEIPISGIMYSYMFCNVTQNFQFPVIVMVL